MPITRTGLIEARAFAFHTCDQANLTAIRSARVLFPASTLFASRPDLRGVRREESVVVKTAHGPVVVRDNRPLAAGAIAFEPGWTLARYIQEQLDARVFFWPGTADGPSSRGKAHFDRYKESGVAVLRVALGRLLQCNSIPTFEVTRFNTGSARMQRGEPVVRGPSCFHPLARAPFRASEVAELTFRGEVRLPSETEYAFALNGPWNRLWTAA